MLRCSRTGPNQSRTDGALKRMRMNESCGQTPAGAAAARLRVTQTRETRACVGLRTTALGHTALLPTAASRWQPTTGLSLSDKLRSRGRGP